MFNFNSLRGLSLALLMLTAACGSSAQDLSAQFHADASDLKPRPQLPAMPSRQFSAVDPARIVVIGDSLAQGIGIFLDQRVAERNLAAVVINRGETSTGLSRSDFYNWPARFAQSAPDLRADIVVAHFGANDNQAINRPEGRASLGTEAWLDAYREQTRAILDTAAANGITLILLGPAPDRSSSINAHMQRINPIFEKEARLSGARYLPIADFASDNGAYAKSVRVNGRTVSVRSGDGTHFTGVGYTLIADKVLEDLEARAPSIFDNPAFRLAGILQ